MDVDEMGNPSENETMLFPNPDDMIYETDVLLVVGTDVDIEAFRES